MCFSDQMTKDGNSYQCENGWVFVGYKTVAQYNGTLMPWIVRREIDHILVRLVSDGVKRHIAPMVSHMDRHYYQMRGFAPDSTKDRFEEIIERAVEGCFSELCTGNQITDRVMQQVTDEFPVPFFTPYQLQEDHGHGFHAAASKKEALSRRAANPFGTVTKAQLPQREWSPSQELMPQEQIKTEEACAAPGVLVKVLIPECSVDKFNHFHAMMVIPPDGEVTDEHLAACDEWNRKCKAGDFHEQIKKWECWNPTCNMDGNPTMGNMMHSMGNQFYQQFFSQPPNFPGAPKSPPKSKMRHGVITGGTPIKPPIPATAAFDQMIKEVSFTNCSSTVPGTAAPLMALDPAACTSTVHEPTPEELEMVLGIKAATPEQVQQLNEMAKEANDEKNKRYIPKFFADRVKQLIGSK